MRVVCWVTMDNWNVFWQVLQHLCHCWKFSQERRMFQRYWASLKHNEGHQQWPMYFFVNLLFVWHTALGPFTFWLYTVPRYQPSSLSIAVVWIGLTSGLGMWFRPKQWYVIQSEPTWYNLGFLLRQLKEMWTWAVKMELLAAILLLQETEVRDEERKTKSWYFLSLLIPGSVIPLEFLLLWAYKIPVCLHQDNVSGFPSFVIHQVHTDVLI